MTDSGAQGTPAARTVGGFDHDGRLWVLTLCAIVGTAIGALLPPVARWAAELPWAPFQGPLRLLGSFDDPWLGWGRPGLGLVAGLTFGAWLIVDSAVLEIGPERINVRRRGQVERVIERDVVASVRPRGSTIIIETDRGRTLFARDVEGDKAVVRSAFVDQGYPWEGPRE
ncbi:hypothetical protein [Cellulomonas sp. URHE0023]|uniref:YqeB family protein n=1 Tax=Cellulomonas sp. URHE0023 TaxID=1380354 RepID=UPI0004823170|nr:hypothetical protein [Cellulomonas sp. URHE0023]